MIMMRSNPANKVNKPPPPVPPRPSKTIVAEALAKTRRYENVQQQQQHRSPPVVKSQSYSSINNYGKVVSKIDSAICVDEPPRPTTRTLVYQSANSRSGNIAEIKINIGRSASVKRENPVCRTSSFKTPKPEPLSLVKPTNVCTITCNNEYHPELSRDSSLESLGESGGGKAITKNNNNNEISSDSEESKLDDNWNEINDRNHVNTLIDEMFASVLDLPDDKPELVQVINENVTTDKITVHYDEEKKEDTQKTIVVIEDEECTKKVHFESNSSTAERKKKIDDKFNHELLISELAGMKKEQDRIMRRQRKPSLDIYENESKIHTSDWVEVNNGQEIRLSSCQITIENGRNEMSNLHGLPPLPKSLSGFNLIESPQTPGRPGSSRNISPAGYSSYPVHQKAAPNGDVVGSLKKGNNLDAKLALLRREMYSLRQLDLSLLSQLWSLNESIQDFRHMLQEQDDRNILSPPSPSPTPSSGEDADGDDFYAPSPLRFRPAPPPPPHRRPSNSSTGTGSSV